LSKGGEKFFVLLYYWTNDNVARENSYNSEIIEYPAHVEWFHRQMTDENSIILIFEENNVPIGVVRFNKDTRVCT